MSRNRIVGVLAAVWGAGILISFLLRSGSIGGGAYGVGQFIALIAGVLLLGAGLYAAVPGGKRKSE